MRLALARRRLSDGVIHDYCLKRRIDQDRVDARMGWKEAERLRDMQTYYEEELTSEM